MSILIIKQAMESEMSAVIEKFDHNVFETGRTTHNAFIAQASLPWTPWVMEGTWFRLLNINAVSGGFTMMLKVSPHNEAPLHGHFGAVEGYIVEGDFSYPGDPGHTGDYVYEGAGVRHVPTTGEHGLVMFAVVHGPLGGFHPDGSVAAVVDARLMYELAVSAGAAGHITKPPHW